MYFIDNFQTRRPPEPISGFKRCYHSKNDTTPALNTIVKSYKTRRELRLTKYVNVSSSTYMYKICMYLFHTQIRIANDNISNV